MRFSELVLQEDKYPKPLCRFIRTVTWLLRALVGIVVVSSAYDPYLYTLNLFYTVTTPVFGPVTDLIPIASSIIVFQDPVNVFSVIGGLAVTSLVDYLASAEEGCISMYQPLSRLAKMIASKSQILRAITSSE